MGKLWGGPLGESYRSKQDPWFGNALGLEYGAGSEVRDPPVV